MNSLILGIIIGIIISYSNLLSLSVGIFLGLIYRNPEILNEIINKVNQ